MTTPLPFLHDLVLDDYTQPTATFNNDRCIQNMLFAGDYFLSLFFSITTTCYWFETINPTMINH